jgi:hypothetical protein
MTSTNTGLNWLIDGAGGAYGTGGVALVDAPENETVETDAPWLVTAEPLCDDGKKFGESEEEEEELGDEDGLGDDDADDEDSEFDDGDELEDDEDEFFDDDEEDDDLDADLDEDEDDDF